MNRRILIIEFSSQTWRLESLQVEKLDKDPREDYLCLSGEPLCQYLLRQDHGSMVIARGPMPFLSGNKAVVGYVSPLTRVPHYSFVGGRAAAQLLNLGLDAIWFRTLPSQGQPQNSPKPYVVIHGRAPGLDIRFKPSSILPQGQRSAYYWLLQTELGHDEAVGSIFTVGRGADLGLASANVAVDAMYHAGRGGAGKVFWQFASAMVLSGKPMDLPAFFPGDKSDFAKNPNAAIKWLMDKECARLSQKTGGTVVKLFATGCKAPGQNTLPALNGQKLGYNLADIGGPKILKATRHGQTGCHWCQVDCRHWHWVPADYAPGGRDKFLDDFEPAYAIYAMLGLKAKDESLQSKLDLIADVDKRIMLPIEELGCDVINVGTGLAALFEGVKKQLVPLKDVPDFVANSTGLGDMEAVVKAVKFLVSGGAGSYPGLMAAASGPETLAEQYPALKDIVFTSGKGTFGNSGHCNALWTFLMPFSRFFGHYVGQYYKVSEKLPPPGSSDPAYQECFTRVVSKLLEREFYWLLCNAFSMCAFTSVIFSQDAKGECLSQDGLLVRVLKGFGIHVSREDLEWFGQAFWAQSMDLKRRLGWHPPEAADLPKRIYEALSKTLAYQPDELQHLMAKLIAEWKTQAGAVMQRFGYEGFGERTVDATSTLACSPA